MSRSQECERCTHECVRHWFGWDSRTAAPAMGPRHSIPFPVALQLLDFALHHFALQRAEM